MKKLVKGGSFAGGRVAVQSPAQDNKQIGVVPRRHVLDLQDRPNAALAVESQLLQQVPVAQSQCLVCV